MVPLEPKLKSLSYTQKKDPLNKPSQKRELH